MFKTVYKLPFRLLGIPVHLDISLLLVLPLLAWIIGNDVELFVKVFQLDIDPSQLMGGVTPYLYGLLAAIGLFLSVLIHELGHSVVGQHYGLKIRRITLWILGGMAQFERIPRQRGTEAIMAIAGPITSFLLGGLSWLAFHSVPVDAAGLRFVLAYLMYMNVVLAVFNLIPALPLDGGRVLRSLLALRMPYLRATQIAAGTSKFLAVLLGMLGFVSLNIWFMLIAFFIYMAVSGETQYAMVSTLLKGIDVDDLMTREVVTVSPETPATELIRKMFRERHLSFPVVDHSGSLMGIVTLQDIRKLKATGGDESSVTVADIMSRDIGQIGEHESALEAFQRISHTPSGRLLVTDPRGSLRGIISKTDLIRAVQVRMVGMDLDEMADFDPVRQ